MNKRKLGLYVALLAIIIGGAPYFTGYLAQTKFQDVMVVASEFEPVNVTILQYDRGWRKSYAKTLVTLKGKTLEKLMESIEKSSGHPENAKQGLDIILEHEIRHGPFVQLHDGDYRHWRFALAAIHSKVFLTERAKEILQAELGDTELVDIKSIINIEGDVNTQVEGRTLSIKDPDGKSHVFWKGLHALLRLTRDMKHFEGETLIPGFDFYWRNKHIVADGIRFKSERFKSPEGLWLGKGTLSLQKMEVNETPELAGAQDKSKALEKPWALSMLTMGGVIDADGGMIDSTTTLSIQEFDYDNKKWGPINVALTLKNVETQVAQKYFNLSRKMQMDPNPIPAIYLQNAIEHLPELLRSRPEFNVENLNIHTENGDIKGLWNFAIGGANANDINNIKQVVQSIASKANLLFPKALLVDILTNQYMKSAEETNKAAIQLNQKPLTEEELKTQVAKQAEGTINKQIQEGILIEKDHSYLMEIELFQGILKINGKAMDIPQGGVGSGTGTPGSAAPGTPATPQTVVPPKTPGGSSDVPVS